MVSFNKPELLEYSVLVKRLTMLSNGLPSRRLLWGIVVSTICVIALILLLLAALVQSGAFVSNKLTWDYFLFLVITNGSALLIFVIMAGIFPISALAYQV